MSAYMQKSGLKLFRQHLEHYTPPDPRYEHYNDARGRQRRKKRDPPPGLSPRDVAILKSVQRRAAYLDKSFNLCGVRFGWTFIITIVPVAGDLTCAALNYYLVVRKAREADLPAWLVGRMMFNATVSACSGFVPLVGDVIVAVYKANSRNAMLLEEFLRVRGEANLKQQAEKVEEASRGRSVASGASQKDSTQVQSGTTGKKKKTTLVRGDRGRFVEHMNA